LGIVNQSLVQFDYSFVLLHQSLLSIHLLGGDGVLFQQLLIARQVEFGVFLQGLVAQQLSLRLGEGCLVGSRIQFRQ